MHLQPLRRYRYGYKAFTDPSSVAAVVDNKTVKTYLLTSGIRQKGEFYDAVIALEQADTGEVRSHTSIQKTLSEGFRSRWGEWPESVDELREHFLAHPPETL